MLDLSHNCISSIPRDLLFARLVELNLASNDLVRGEQWMALGTLPVLGKLDLSNNRMSSSDWVYDEGAPIPFPKLTHLNLAGNRIHSIDTSQFRRIQVVALAGNPLRVLQRYTAEVHTTGRMLVDDVIVVVSDLEPRTKRLEYRGFSGVPKTPSLETRYRVRKRARTHHGPRQIPAINQQSLEGLFDRFTAWPLVHEAPGMHEKPESGHVKDAPRHVSRDDDSATQSSTAAATDDVYQLVTRWRSEMVVRVGAAHAKYEGHCPLIAYDGRMELVHSAAIELPYDTSELVLPVCMREPNRFTCSVYPSVFDSVQCILISEMHGMMNFYSVDTDIPHALSVQLMIYHKHVFPRFLPQTKISGSLIPRIHIHENYFGLFYQLRNCCFRGHLESREN